MSLSTPLKAAALIATIAVATGFAAMPYGYYMLLRMLLCGLSLYFLSRTDLALDDWQRWTLGGLAVLYNPIFPTRIGEKSLWEILNVATIVVFWVVANRAR